MRKRQQYGFLLLTLLTLSSLASALCYYPDGRSQTSDEYKECSYRNGTVSMCCATNRDIPSGGNFTKGFTADGCLSNGLCQNKAEITNDDGSTFMATTYWREMCSMPEYASSGCLDVCTSDLNNGSSTDNIRITPCDGTLTSETWCCGTDDNCCGSDGAITIAALFGASTTSTIEIASATSNAATSSAATETAISTSSSSAGLSDGAKAGIGVGVGVGAVAIIVAVALWVVRMRKQKGKVANRIDVAETGPVTAAAVPGAYQGYTVVQMPRELEGNGVRNRAFEKPAGLEDIRHELDGESGRGIKRGV